VEELRSKTTREESGLRKNGRREKPVGRTERGETVGKRKNLQEVFT